MTLTNGFWLLVKYSRLNHGLDDFHSLNVKNILITRRDVDMLNWINGVGFVNIDQITEHYKISRETAYARLRKLIAHN